MSFSDKLVVGQNGHRGWCPGCGKKETRKAEATIIKGGVATGKMQLPCCQQCVLTKPLILGRTINLAGLEPDVRVEYVEDCLK